MPGKRKDEDSDIDREMAREGWTRVPASVSKNARAVFGIRLSAEEMELFSEAAKARHMTLADFLRSSARAVIAGEARIEWGEIEEQVRRLNEVVMRNRTQSTAHSA
jgi:hypothetical protein